MLGVEEGLFGSKVVEGRRERDREHYHLGRASLVRKKKRVGERKEGPRANSSSPATINLWPKEIHNN